MPIQAAKPYHCIVVNAPYHVHLNRYACHSFTPLKNKLIELGYNITSITPQFGSWGFKAVLVIEFGPTHAHGVSAFKLDRVFANAKHGRADYKGPNSKETEPYLWISTEEDNAYLGDTAVTYNQAPYATIFDGEIEGDAEQADAYTEVLEVFKAMYP